MPKFKVLSIFVILFLLIQSSTIWAQNREKSLNIILRQKIEELENTIRGLNKENVALKQEIAKLSDSKNEVATLRKQVDDLRRQDNNSKQTIANLSKENSNLKKEIANLKNTPKPVIPESNRISPRNRVWEWRSELDFATITIGPRIRIHCRPDINAPTAPGNPEWTEHENIHISIGDIQPGPGSIRGWGRPVSYREKKMGGLI